VLLAAMASPGPAFVYALAYGGNRRVSRRASPPGPGWALVAALWTGAALLGLDAVFRLFPWAYGALRVAGAAYLIWIAVQTWRAAGTPPQARAPAAHAGPFAAGLLVNLGNPKSVLFAAAVLVVIFPPD
jgi:threonine/homoserine/homoserine lactone efflux protein